MSPGHPGRMTLVSTPPRQDPLTAAPPTSPVILRATLAVLLTGAALALGGCGNRHGPPADGGPGPAADGGWFDSVARPDLGGRDAVPLPDTTSPGDGRGDASGPFGPRATLLPLASWQRGPVVLRYQLRTDRQPAISVAVDFSDDGTAFRPATCMTDVGVGDACQSTLAPGTHRFVWDSHADLAGRQLAAVTLRLTPSDGSGAGPAVATPPFALDNRRDRPRVVLVTHAINGLDGLSVLELDAAGELALEQRLQIGKRPTVAAFSPNGRLAVIANQEGESLSVLHIGPGGETRLDPELPLGGRYLAGLAFSADGSRLFLSDGNGTSEGGVYAADVAEDGRVALDPAFFAPLPLASTVVLLPARNLLALLAGVVGGSPTVALLGVDGRLADSAALGSGDGLIGQSLASAGPAAPALLMTALCDLFGPGSGVVAVDLSLGGGSQRIERVRQALRLEDPADVVFHPSGKVALVAQAEPNLVVAVEIPASGPATVVGGPIRVDLATSMAGVTEGALAGLVLVATVSASSGESGLARIVLAADGSLTERPTFSFGRGIEQIPEAVAIQP